jgi:hypothetical protein
MNQLEEWSHLKCDKVLFDSDCDAWSVKKSVFRKNVLNKSKISIIIEDETGNIFGCYIDKMIDINKQQWGVVKISDQHAFIFNLQSNGRHPAPIKFDIKKEECDRAFYMYPDSDYRLFYCGNADILIFKENEKSWSCCWQNENSRFDYRGVENALVQNPYDDCNNGKDFTPKRIIVIQMNKK